MTLTANDLKARDADGVVFILLNGTVLCQYTKEQDGRLVIGYLHESVAAQMHRENIAWYLVEAAIVDRLLNVLNRGAPEYDSAP